MVESDRMRADLVVDHRVTCEQDQPLTDALVALGFSPSTRVLPPRRPIEPLSWLILVALPLHAFLTTLGNKAAEGAYRQLHAAVANLRGLSADSPTATAPTPTRPVVLQDPTTGLRIVLEPDLPEAAYQQLSSLDLSRYRLGPLHYDQTRGCWRSELDEAAPH
ncbi:hypothetical protein ACFU96_40495 [Streptomyces sp. NPDC057620]|uniref:hypothetical protein n=1 Tax=Streptomyces sp. NPDC057620 TaxID=3346185 RepID=UPI0036B82A0C